eukprot:Cvel_18210.t1-p1 / transcript=Cvel_18210.t1 / gene=Cvel_18210 / organism=Chromera_velia_CCMP2878 / gene_product=hypothetical protein / transcript_product=hypothetical protein / location=Cvel_scaffold1495:42927-43846(+) / protein_length=112 / sequence_SO=supercontig / SO=protein_coding / is_pseudo=false
MTIGPQILATGHVIVPFDSFEGQFADKITSQAVEERLGEGGRGRFGPNMAHLSRIAQPHTQQLFAIQDKGVEFVTSCNYLCWPCGKNQKEALEMETAAQNVTEVFFSQIESE